MNFIVKLTQQPEDQLGGASGDKYTAEMKFLVKQNNAEWPHQVANELVAAKVGAFLGLHVPTVFPHRELGGRDFALVAWHERLPAESSAMRDFVAGDPFAVHAAIVFDLYIANNDRAFNGLRNMRLEKDRLLLYDHGNAFFYRNRTAHGIKAGVERLDAVEQDLRAMNDMAHKGNVYFQLLNDWALTNEMCDRVEAIPLYAIEAAVKAIPADSASPTPSERDRLYEFMVRRRSLLRGHLRECCGTLFPRLTPR